jgi:hypothetical protein
MTGLVTPPGTALCEKSREEVFEAVLIAIDKIAGAKPHCILPL